MEFRGATSLAVFYLFSHIMLMVTAAPTGHVSEDLCETMRHSTQELNRIAKHAVKSGYEAIKNFSFPLAWIEAGDMCDPGNLRRSPERCITKMLDVLSSYVSFVNTVVELPERCPVAEKVQRVMLKLHKDMSQCVKSKTNYEEHSANVISKNDILRKDSWYTNLLCPYVMERLFSFSILTARVFSEGDPTNHTETPHLSCVQRS